MFPIVAALPLERIIDGFGPEIETHTRLFPVKDIATFESISTLEATKKAIELFSTIQVKVTSSYQTKHNKVHHVYLEQLYRGLQVTNAVGAVHVDEFGCPLQATHAFLMESPQLAIQMLQEPETPTLDCSQALESFASYLGMEIKSIKSNQECSSMSLNHVENIPVSLKYILTETGMNLVWDLELDLDKNWFHTQIDAHNGNVLGLVDWVSHATFQVFPFGLNDPLDGPRKLIRDPENPLASPLGWNTQVKGKKSRVFTTTIGNNVYAQENPNGGSNWKSNRRPKAKDLIFNFKAELDQEPDTYIDAAIVNLFYWNNMIHDLFYLYGFNEVAGNFQDNNLGRGGLEGDSVIANAQDGSGTNNANFATPPDGRQGRMRMYVWTQTKPNRDGDFEAGIIIHEYAHGISTRLTGGPSNSGCLGWGEAGGNQNRNVGMGEGWGDFFATILRTNVNTTRETDFSMGSYSNGGKGIRKYVYSTNIKTNPSTYAFIRKPGYFGVHAKGEVWAEIMYELYWNLVDKHGYDPHWFQVPQTVTEKVAGNKLALRLVVDGLKLQPCSPSFVDARDAILLADQINNNGTNVCEIYQAFAKRGLGVHAVKGGREDFTLPDSCL